MKNEQKSDRQNFEDLYKDFQKQIADLKKKQDKILDDLQKKIEEYKQNEILSKIKN